MQSEPLQTPPLFFMHIPKTAGTTLWLILQRQYSPERVFRADTLQQISALTAEQLKGVQVVIGHVPYGAQNLVQPPMPCLTILREPIEWLLSYMAHIARAPRAEAAPYYFDPSGRRLSIIECLQSGIADVDNLQTRMMAGIEAYHLPYGQIDRDVFELAKHNLSQGVAVAGLTERFDETAVLLQQRYQWSMPCYSKENVAANRRDNDPDRQQIKELAVAHTQWDQELYRHASERLDQMIAEEGPRFETALRRFKQANKRYQWMKGQVASGMLREMKRRLPLNQQRGLENIIRRGLRYWPS